MKEVDCRGQVYWRLNLRKYCCKHGHMHVPTSKETKEVQANYLPRKQRK